MALYLTQKLLKTPCDKQAVSPPTDLVPGPQREIFPGGTKIDVGPPPQKNLSGFLPKFSLIFWP